MMNITKRYQDFCQAHREKNREQGFFQVGNHNCRVLGRKLGLECHHVKPKALGGTRDANNTIWLSVKDHTLAHTLLSLGTIQQGNMSEVKKVFCPRLDFNGKLIDAKELRGIHLTCECFRDADGKAVLKSLTLRDAMKLVCLHRSLDWESARASNSSLMRILKMMSGWDNKHQAFYKWKLDERSAWKRWRDKRKQALAQK